MQPDKVERRLAAILHADVQGYSRLLSEDEPTTLRLLSASTNGCDKRRSTMDSCSG
jgi:class 3 adenylate cyclase